MPSVAFRAGGGTLPRQSRNAAEGVPYSAVMQSIPGSPAPGLAELLEAAFVEISELVVGEAQEVQQRNVEVADVMDIFDSARAQLVGRADRAARLNAAAGEPDAHRFGVVIAAGNLSA